MDLNRVAVFARVVEVRSFTAARRSRKIVFSFASGTKAMNYLVNQRLPLTLPSHWNHRLSMVLPYVSAGSGGREPCKGGNPESCLG